MTNLIGIAKKRLNIDDIIAAASDETGLSDMGSPDIANGLNHLIYSFVNESNFTPMGIEAQRANLIRVIANRFRVQALLEKHPEILNEPIAAPVLITGLPRSGTTKILRLLAADDRFQTLKLWKILHPVPLTEGTDDAALRFSMAERLSFTMRDNFPDFYAGHPMKADEPDEEEWLLDMVMLGYVNCHSSHTPSFEKWMNHQDFTPWYRYLKILLQVLQWQEGAQGRPWLLKAPSHLQHMRLIFKFFPEATVVHCHRDPVVSISSIAALIERSREMYSDQKKTREAGKFALSHWAMQMRRYMEQRPNLETEHHFVDLAYRDIVNNSIDALDHVYKSAGIEFCDEHRGKLAAWESKNPQDKHGKHRYDMASYGYTKKSIQEEFKTYLNRFSEFV